MKIFIITVILAVLKRAMELFTDKSDGRMSHTKIGMIIAGTAFTYKMVISLPDDPTLWLVYTGTIGGYSAAFKFMSLQYPARSPDKPP